MKSIRLRVKDNVCDIFIGYNLLPNVSAYISKRNIGNFAVIVTSTKVYSLYHDRIHATFKGIPHALFTLPNGEDAKSKNWLFKILDTLIESDGLGQKLYLVCWGGGTVGDVGALAASIYKRGIPYIQIPTTLLSQIDASIGGKTAIDMPHAKNSVGTFYQARAVFIDPFFLETLPLDFLKEGLSEAIKYALIKDRRLFAFLLQNHSRVVSLSKTHMLRLITTCAMIKTKVVAQDPYETKGVRTILNFGHTLAHALEASLRFKKLSHGYAVSLGILYAAYLSFLLGRCRKKDVDQIRDILALYSLPITTSFDESRLLKSLRYDKKFITGNIRMVLLKSIGRVEVRDAIPFGILRKALKILAPSH